MARGLESLAREISTSEDENYPRLDNNDSNYDVKQQIREYEGFDNTFDDSKSFNDHISHMREIIESEYEQKKKFRKIATYGAFGLVIYSICFISFVFWYLIVKKDYTPSASVLIGLSVSFVANIIGLATVVFKYVFSSTKETTDYISNMGSKK